MSELDLVPPRYRRRRKAIDLTRSMGVLYVAVCLFVVGLRFVLDQQVSRHGEEIEAMRAKQADAERAQAEYALLEGEKEDLDDRIRALEGLRGGVAAIRMFSLVDAALSEDIWFKQWSFRRAGETVEAESTAVETGYFILLPRTDDDSPRRAWRMHTHMEIIAEASDHGALAAFVHRLSRQPQIESVRILSTRGQRESDGGRVAFELALLVRSAP